MEKEELDSSRVFVIHDFLSPEECSHLIAYSEATRLWRRSHHDRGRLRHAQGHPQQRARDRR